MINHVRHNKRNKVQAEAGKRKVNLSHRRSRLCLSDSEKWLTVVASSDVQSLVPSFWYLLRRNLTYERKSVLGSTHDTAPESHGSFSRGFFTPVCERILAVLCQPCRTEKSKKCTVSSSGPSMSGTMTMESFPLTVLGCRLDVAIVDISKDVLLLQDTLLDCNFMI